MFFDQIILQNIRPVLIMQEALQEAWPRMAQVRSRLARGAGPPDINKISLFLFHDNFFPTQDNRSQY